MASSFQSVFANIPLELCEKLEEHYNKVKHSFVLGRYEPAELNGGKFSEIVARILEWHTNRGTYAALGQRFAKDFGTICRDFEGKKGFPDSVRLHIPQVLNALYPIRNKRGVAHHAKEVDPNHMDATFVVACADWVMAELVRLFHQVTTAQAQTIVEGLISKQIPTVWQVGQRKRVISPPERKLKTTEKILLLLYDAHPNSLTSRDLASWTDYDPKNRARFRNELLKQLHDDDLIDFEPMSDNAHISPLGIAHVEKNLPLALEAS